MGGREALSRRSCIGEEGRRHISVRGARDRDDAEGLSTRRICYGGNYRHGRADDVRWLRCSVLGKVGGIVLWPARGEGSHGENDREEIGWSAHGVGMWKLGKRREVEGQMSTSSGGVDSQNQNVGMCDDGRVKARRDEEGGKRSRGSECVARSG